MTIQINLDPAQPPENLAASLKQMADLFADKMAHKEWDDILGVVYDPSSGRVNPTLFNSLQALTYELINIEWQNQSGFDGMSFFSMQETLVRAVAQAAINHYAPYRELMRNTAEYQALPENERQRIHDGFEQSHNLLLWLHNEIKMKGCACTASQLGLELEIGAGFMTASYAGYNSALAIQWFKDAMDKPVSSPRHRHVAAFLSQIYENGEMGCERDLNLSHRYALAACNNRGNNKDEQYNIAAIQRLDRLSQNDRAREASIKGRGQFNIAARQPQFDMPFGPNADMIQAAVPYLKHSDKGSFASAFLIDDHYLLTNSHCVNDTNFVDLYFFTTFGECLHRKAEVVYHGNEYRDVAVLRIRDPVPGVEPLPLRLDRPYPGTRAFGVGNIAGICPAGFFGGDIIGYGSAITPEGFDKLGWMFNSCTYYKGTSGGPMIDEYGNVIGVIARIQFNWCFHFQHNPKDNSFDITRSDCIKNPDELQNYKLAVPIQNAIDAAGINII